MSDDLGTDEQGIPYGRPRTARLPRTQAQRAVQFMPFAALSGYGRMLEEARRKAERKGMGEDYEGGGDADEWA